MIYRGYPERDLVSNRSSLLLYGSTEAERRAWAEEAAACFEAEGPLHTVTSDDELRARLPSPNGVLFVPDVSALSDTAQGEIVLALRQRDERPKLIIGVIGSPDTAREHGRLRADLQYALQMAQVNLDQPDLKDAIRARRARAPKKTSARRAPAPKNKSSKVTVKVIKPKAKAKATPAPKKAPARRRR